MENYDGGSWVRKERDRLSAASLATPTDESGGATPAAPPLVWPIQVSR